jgi:hypothetical protein
MFFHVLMSFFVDFCSRTKVQLIFTTDGNCILFCKATLHKGGELKNSECLRVDRCGDLRLLIPSLKECQMN